MSEVVRCAECQETVWNTQQAMIEHAKRHNRWPLFSVDTVQYVDGPGL